MASEPLVSVVIPFYNTEKYLEECINSVLSQTYQNFELILQDNCSTDRSLSIAREFAAIDSRIRLFQTTDFLGQVQNYNAALTRISPRSVYTKIVQADDYIFRHCLEEMVAVAESDSGVGLVSSFGLKGTKVTLGNYPFADSVVSGREVARYELLTIYGFHGSPTTVMYRSEIVREKIPFYEEGVDYEDTYSCFEVLETWKFGFVKQVLSFSRVDPDSIMARIARLDPHYEILADLILMRRFGPRFLSEDEFRLRWSEVEKRYLDHIGYSVWLPWSPAFWDFQRRSLRIIDYPLGRMKIGFHAARYLLTLPFRPREVKKVADGLRAAFRVGLPSSRGAEAAIPCDIQSHDGHPLQVSA